jgi:hypothetical protein
VASLHSRAPGRAVLALAGGVAALAGVAGVVANWERPSSFSPLVRFPGPEVAILAAGALLLAGAYLVVRAAGAGRLDGALVCATAAASVAGLAWWAVAGLTRGLSSVAEQPVESALVALAWGCVVVTLPRMLRREGAARVGALFAVAPLLLSALIWLEQAVGVAGPQPLIVTGVAAGGVTIAAAFLVLWWSRVADPVSGRKPLMLAVAAVPLALAGVALALPAVVARADVSGATGSFVGSWTLLGWESVAGLSALALAALLASLAWTRAAAMPALVALVACAVWPWNLATPMHVLTGWLTPGIEQYYGTEYGSISFTAVSNVWMIAAVAACAAGLVVLIVSELPRRARRAAAKSGE